MHAVAADPASRRSAGHDQPQPLPRPGQRHRSRWRNRSCPADGCSRGLPKPKASFVLSSRPNSMPSSGSPLALSKAMPVPGVASSTWAMTSYQARPGSGHLASAVSVVFSAASSTQPSPSFWKRAPAGKDSFQASCAGLLAVQHDAMGGRDLFRRPARCARGPGLAASRRWAVRGKGLSPGLPGERSSGGRCPWSPRRPRFGNGFDTRRQAAAACRDDHRSPRATQGANGPLSSTWPRRAAA